MFQRIFRIAAHLMLCCPALPALSQTTIAEQIKRYVERADSAENDDGYKAAMLRADSFAASTGDVAARGRINRDIGSHYYEVDPDECIKYLQKAHRFYLAADKRNDAAYCLHNIAFCFEDQKKDPEEAMKYTKRAIAARTEMKDTGNMANMYKYQAMLYGKLHDYQAGKASAAKAIRLYAAKKEIMGIAVSYRDLAIVYEEEGEYDSAMAWMLKAKEIWSDSERKEKHASRIYGNNTDMIRIHTKAANTIAALALVRENERIDVSNFHYSDKLRFYKETADMYAKSRDREQATFYHDKYGELRDKMRAEGKRVE